MLDRLATYLESLACTNLRKLHITIRKTTYEAVEYVQPDTDGRKRIYVLGELPRCYVRSSRTCFRVPGSKADHYIACYMSAARITPEFAQFHPFGANFMLLTWDLPDAIDRYDRTPYTRIAMAVSPV